MSVPAAAPVVAHPGQVYRRLLGYARPYVGTFLIGVLVFDDAASAARIASVALIISGVIGLRLAHA